MPLIWILTDGRTGMTAQARGLANRIVKIDGGTVRQNIVVAPAFTKLLPPSWVAALRLCHTTGEAGEVPNMVICCGQKSQAAALVVKRQFGAFAVCLQRPRADEKKFDAVVAPQHDYSTTELHAMQQTTNGKIIATLGAVGLIAAEELQRRRTAARERFAHIPNPKTGVLIGGANRAFSLTSDFCTTIAAAVSRADPSGGVLVTTSRRTGADERRALAREFTGDNIFFYGGEGGDNPYLDILAAADRLLITGDSVNMMSEACAAAKPAQIICLPQKSARAARKFYRFHQALIAQDLARPWRDEFICWTPPGLDETTRAADFVLARYHAGI